MELNKDEKIDDLQVNGLQLIQNSKKYCFTTDAVLLANFVKVKRGDILLDFCSGSGVVPILILGKTDKIKTCYAVEVSEYFSSIISRNAALNHLPITAIHASVQESVKLLENKGINIISVNPPYRKPNSGSISRDELSIARQEVLLSLAELIFSASKILQTGGRFYMVHLCSRLGEIFYEMGKQRLTPKTLRFVRSKKVFEPHLVLVEGIKGGGDGLKILPDLIIQNNDGSETAEICAIYQRKDK